MAFSLKKVGMTWMAWAIPASYRSRFFVCSNKLHYFGLNAIIDRLDRSNSELGMLKIINFSIAEMCIDKKYDSSL
jgi:hypothetical protein